MLTLYDNEFHRVVWESHGHVSFPKTTTIGSSSKGALDVRKPQPLKLYGILIDGSKLSQVMAQRCCLVCTLVIRMFQARLLPTQTALPELRSAIEDATLSDVIDNV